MIDARTAHQRRWYALALLATAQFLIILDVTIVNIALPSIAKDLGFSQEGLTWVVNAYLLLFGGLLLLGGRLADLFGRRRVFMTGLALFGLASLACGFSTSDSQLLAFRAVQGIGGALLSPAALSLVAATFTEPKELGRAFGVWGGVAGAGGATGVVLGGVLSQGPGWEWVFWVPVPIALLGCLLAPLVVQSTPGSREGHFDIFGAVAVTVGLACLVYGLVQIEAAGIGSGRALGPLAAAVVLLVAFAMLETRVPHPLVPPRILRSRATVSANVTMLLFAAAVVAMNFIVSLYLQLVLDFSPIEAGVAFLPMALGQIVFSQVASRVMDRIGPRTMMLLGLVVSAVGFAWFGAISADGTYVVDVLGPAIVVSVGGAFTIVPMMVLAVSGVDMQDTGLAGGLINMSQQVGGAIGLAVLVSLAAWRIDNVASGGAPDAGALSSGYRVGLLGAAALTLLAAVLATVMLPMAKAAPAGAPAAEAPAPDAAGDDSRVAAGHASAPPPATPATGTGAVASDSVASTDRDKQ